MAKAPKTIAAANAPEVTEAGGGGTARDTVTGASGAGEAGEGATETGAAGDQEGAGEGTLETVLEVTPNDLVEAMLTSPMFVDGVVALVRTHLDLELEQRLASFFDGDAFKLNVAAGVDAHFRAEDSELPARINDYLDKNLSDMIKTVMPETVISVDTALTISPEAARAVAVLMDDRAVETAAAERQAALAEARAAAVAQARDDFTALMTGFPHEGSIPLPDVQAAKLRLDDGIGFSIDFSLGVPVDALSWSGDAVLLTHPAIAIGDDMPEAFTAKGVTLILQGVEGFVGLRCELSQPILVGGGQRAQLGENSLLFRALR